MRAKFDMISLSIWLLGVNKLIYATINHCNKKQLLLLLLRHWDLTRWRPAAFGDFRKKTQTHVDLHGNISTPLRVTDLVEASIDTASLLVYTQKKFFAWGVRVFCEWRHKWRTFRPPWPTLPGSGCQPLGGSISLKFFWKLGHNPSLLILWMTCWGFGFKNYDVS